MKKMNLKKCWKRTMALLLSAGMLATAIGCGSGSGQTSNGGGNEEYKYDPTKEVELSGTFELQIYTAGYGSEAWEEIISAFEEEYPDLDVVAYLDSNVNKQMQSRWIQGNPPDFVYLAGGNMPTVTYMDEGKLLDLTDFYETATVHGSDKLLKDHITSDLVKPYKGGIYRLPIIMECMGMWYDEAYLQDLGLQVPANIDELMKFSEDIKAKGGTCFIYPGQANHYLLQGFVMPALAAYGQEYYDRITSAADVEAFQDERFKEVLTRFKTFADAGYIAEGAVALNHTQSQIQWLNHRAAFIPNGLWLENEMKDDTPEGFKMRFTPSMLTTSDQDRILTVSSSGIGVASEAKNKDAALEFIRFLYRDENIGKFAELANVPVAADIDLTGINLSETAQNVQKVLNDPAYTLISHDVTWGGVDSAVCDSVNRIALGECSVDEAIATIVEAVEKHLQGM